MNINCHMNIFTKNNNKFSKCKHNPSISEKEIEIFLEKHPYILEDNLVIIGRQVHIESYGVIDLLVSLIKLVKSHVSAQIEYLNI